MLQAPMRPPLPRRASLPVQPSLFSLALAGLASFAAAIRVDGDDSDGNNAGHASMYDYSSEDISTSDPKHISALSGVEPSALVSSVANFQAGSFTTTMATVQREFTTAAAVSRAITPGLARSMPTTDQSTMTVNVTPATPTIATGKNRASTDTNTNLKANQTISQPTNAISSMTSITATTFREAEVINTSSLLEPGDCDCSISEDWLRVPDAGIERVSDVVSNSLKSLIMFVFGGLTSKQVKVRSEDLDKDESNTVSERELPFLTSSKSADLRSLLNHLRVHSFEVGVGTRLSVAALSAAAEVHRVEKLSSAEGLVECKCFGGLTGYRTLPSTFSHHDFKGGLVSGGLLQSITNQLAVRILSRFRDMIAIDVNGDGETDMWISPILIPTVAEKSNVIAGGRTELKETVRGGSGAHKNSTKTKAATTTTTATMTTQTTATTAMINMTATNRTKIFAEMLSANIDDVIEEGGIEWMDSTLLNESSMATNESSTTMNELSMTTNSSSITTNESSWTTNEWLTTNSNALSRLSGSNTTIDFEGDEFGVSNFTFDADMTNLMNLTNLVTGLTNLSDLTNIPNRATLTIFPNFTNNTSITISLNSTNLSIMRDENKGVPVVVNTRAGSSLVSSLRQVEKVMNVTEKTGVADHVAGTFRGKGRKESKKRLDVPWTKSKKKALTDSASEAELFMQADELIKRAGRTQQDGSSLEKPEKEAEIAITRASREVDRLRAEALEELRRAIGPDDSESEQVHRKESDGIPSS